MCNYLAISDISSRFPPRLELDLVTAMRSGEPSTASISRLRCTSFQLSSEVKRSTPAKNKRVKPVHIANHKFCQESGNSRTVAKVAAIIIAKPVDVMKRILRRSRRSRSWGSPLCILAEKRVRVTSAQRIVAVPDNLVVFFLWKRCLLS